MEFPYCDGGWPHGRKILMIYGDWNWTSKDTNLCWSSLELPRIWSLVYALLEEDLWIDL
jgi:hypothetical protein